MRPRQRAGSPLALIALLALLGLAAHGPCTVRGDVAIERFVQRFPDPPFRAVADFGNWAGSARVAVPLLLIVGIALIVRGRPRLVALVALATALRALNGPLKALFDSPRPTPDLVKVTEQAHGLGYPSGHAMGSMLGFGALALVAARLIAEPRLRRLAVAACLALIPVVGFGRVYVGAHWPSDVLGGWLAGGALLLIAAAAVDAVAARRDWP